MIFPTSEMPSHSQLSQINQSNRTKSVYSLNYSKNMVYFADTSFVGKDAKYIFAIILEFEK